VQAVRGALGAEEGVGEGGRARAVGPDVSGAHERARGGAAEVDRAQVAHVQGQVGLPVRRDAVGLAVPDGQQVAAVLAEEWVVDVEDELAAREPAARGMQSPGGVAGRIVAGMSTDAVTLRQQLRDALSVAMKARDRAAVSVLRSTLGAIENAEAVERPETGQRESLAIEQIAVGVGAAEVDRRVLTEDDVRGIVRAELAERESAVGAYERAGRSEYAERLRVEIDVLAPYVRAV
jgi:uncharacterized protein YqeY